MRRLKKNKNDEISDIKIERDLTRMLSAMGEDMGIAHADLRAHIDATQQRRSCPTESQTVVPTWMQPTKVDVYKHM